MTPGLLVAFIIICIFLLFSFVVFFGAPYVPSQKKYVKRAFEYFDINSSDLVVDVGSGDGIILRIASGYGAKAVGYEINPFLVAFSKLLLLRDPKVTVYLQNFWLSTLPKDTTIVYAFAVSRDGQKLTTLMQREANRLNKPLKLLCLGSPLKRVQAVDTFEAYHLYIFQPLQVKNA
jgi:hypothetical protein